MLSDESRAQLMRYVAGEISNEELENWLIGVEYDEAVVESERNALARIRLVMIEVNEGRREASEILDVVSEILAPVMPQRMVRAPRTASTTSWEGQSGLSATPAPVQRVGI